MDDARLVSTDGRFGYSGSLEETLDDDEETVLLLLKVLEDFHYSQLVLEISGDLAGEMAVRMLLNGHNPAVLDGYPFALKMDMAADLMSLLNRSSLGERAIGQIRKSLMEASRSLEE